MNEQEDIITHLGGPGILAGLSWAYRSACGRTLDTYSEADGHDGSWFGNTRHTLLRNRLNRVFSCDRYAGDEGVDEDLLYAELAAKDRVTMPNLDPGLVRLADLQSSPGWAFEQYRFLLASCKYGAIDQIPWPSKSPTKQRVARQFSPDPRQPTLFDWFVEEEVDGLEAALVNRDELDLVTFVVAHSLDPITGKMELVFGRPKLNFGGGAAWHWRQDLLSLPPFHGNRRIDDTPLPTGPSTVPDAPVRLRRATEERLGDRASVDK
ncbi:MULTISPECIES: hypothetical protein [Nocardiopsis]|uniref:Uncharacterized protein n=1 Tax=Nocardiopsis sinuspersici TaxID=501010 RepID=A0A1V3C6Y6_9ACTN|nr:MULTISPECIES: hypothetical protein [Nocardiopsis]OOC56453.1 hypothetical protein NOSIN_23645 [Nocardiopsis sinuspersici]